MGQVWPSTGEHAYFVRVDSDRVFDELRLPWALRRGAVPLDVYSIPRRLSLSSDPRERYTWTVIARAIAVRRLAVDYVCTAMCTLTVDATVGLTHVPSALRTEPRAHSTVSTQLTCGETSHRNSTCSDTGHLLTVFVRCPSMTSPHSGLREL